MASLPKSSKTESAASFPIAASQLIELSKRDAVGDRSMSGPKKLFKGTRAGLPACVDRHEPILDLAGEVAVSETATGVQQELVISRRQHVDSAEILGNRQRTDELRSIDEDDRTHRSRDRTDRLDVGTMSGRASARR